MMILAKPEGSYTDDPKVCVNLLNCFLKNQFCTQFQTDSNTEYQAENNNEITIDRNGVMKLILSLKNGKAPGPHGTYLQKRPSNRPNYDSTLPYPYL